MFQLYKPHSSFKEPEDKDVVIWRYMDFTKFYSMIDSRTLLFTNLSTLDDSFEGFLPKANIKQWTTFPEEMPEDEYEEENDDDDDETKGWIPEHDLKTIKDARKHLFISSWHVNEYESTAMWKLFLKSNEGVAIKSTYNDLKKSLYLAKEDVYLGLIKYIDYTTYKLKSNNIFDLALHKRKSFEHERELRAIIFERSKSPLFIPVDLEILIDRIYTPPTAKPWFRALVERVFEKNDLDKKVVQSSLADEQLY